MEEIFKNAVGIETPQKLLFTSDWDQTINCDAGPNYALLEFLSDAKRAGHRVIFTSSIEMDRIEPVLKAFLRLAPLRGYDLLPMDQFEMICKPDLKAMNLKSDYSFDDESIGGQFYKDYIDANIEVTVQRDFSMFPLSIEQLRERCNIPRAAKGGEHPLPAPVAFK